MDSYTYEETAERLDAYERWIGLVSDGGRELYEGPDAVRAKPLTAPGPMENIKGHQPGRFSVSQIYDAYRICSLVSSLVRRGNHLFSKAPGEGSLRPEVQLEFLFSQMKR